MVRTSTVSPCTASTMFGIPLTVRISSPIRDRSNSTAVGQPGSSRVDGAAKSAASLPASRGRGDVLDDGEQLGAVVLELPPGLAERFGQAADLGLADGLLAAGLSGQVPAGQRGKGLTGRGGAGSAAVGVVAGQQQGT